MTDIITITKNHNLIVSEMVRAGDLYIIQYENNFRKKKYSNKYMFSTHNHLPDALKFLRDNKNMINSVKNDFFGDKCQIFTGIVFNDNFEIMNYATNSIIYLKYYPVITNLNITKGKEKGLEPYSLFETLGFASYNSDNSDRKYYIKEYKKITELGGFLYRSYGSRSVFYCKNYEDLENIIDVVEVMEL